MDIDNVLRPTAFDSYIGQNALIKQLKTHVIAEQLRKERGEVSFLDHIMLEGGAGLGKTSIAFVIAKELGANLKIMQGTSLEHQGQLVANILNLEEGDVFFIDEIHALKPPVQEALLSIMEDFRMDITPTEGDPISMSVPKFTLIGATTEVGKLKKPLISRFVHTFTLQRYTVTELTEILSRSASLLHTEYQTEALTYLAQTSRGTPRVANNLLKKSRNYADVYNDGVLSLEIAKEALNDASIEESGFDVNDRKYIDALLSAKKPVGLKTLSGILSMDVKQIENNVESFLLEQGLIEKHPKGRILSEKGIKVANGVIRL